MPYATIFSSCARILALLAAGPLVLSSPLFAQTDDLPEVVVQSLLAGQWEQVFDGLKETDLREATAVIRLVAAHACTATNRNNLALALFMLTDDEEATKWRNWAENLSRTHPNNAVASYLLGDALARTDDFETAGEAFTRAIAQDAKLGMALIARGMVRALSGKDDEAYCDLVRATTEVAPQLAESHAALGCAEVAMENASAALASFNAALELNPDFALAYNGRGCAHYGLGHPDEANRDFEEAQKTFLPLLGAAASNQACVRAMVRRKVEEYLNATDRKPGTTLVTKTEPSRSETKRLVEDVSKLTRAEIDQLIKQVGFEKARNMFVIHADLLDAQMLRGRASIKMDREAIKRAGTVKMLPFLGASKDFLEFGSGTARTIAREGLKRAGKRYGRQWAQKTAKEGAERLAQGMEGPAGQMTRITIATLDLASKNLDPIGMGLQTWEEMERVQLQIKPQHALHTAGRLLRLAQEYARTQQGIRYIDQKLTESKLQTESLPASGRFVAEHTLAVSGLPWSQVPALANDLGRSVGQKGSVMIVGNTMQAHAVNQMLKHAGISSFMMPPSTEAGLATMRDRLRPSAVVGFKPPTLDDDHRRGATFLPRFPKPNPAASPLGPSFSPSPRSPFRSNEVAQGAASAAGTAVGGASLPAHAASNWNWGRTWAPSGRVGGVDMNMDWAFIDKGDWPVVTFFTLAYGLKNVEPSSDVLRE